MSHYSGVFVFDPKDNMVLCVSDPKYPGDLKMAGGMSVNNETPEETACREASEELRTQILDSIPAFVEVVPGREGKHTRYFFLAKEVSGALGKGATWEVEEKDASGRVVEKLTAKWVSLREFAGRLFPKQFPAFGAVLATLAKEDRKFYLEFYDLLERFPEPEMED